MLLQTRTSGSFCTAARLRPSCQSPRLVAPSPKKTKAALGKPLYLMASAAPAATGTEAAMALMMATILSLRSPMCMLPSLPRVMPPTRPMYWANTCRGWTPRMKYSARSRWQGNKTSSGSATRPAPTAMASWPAPDVDAAHDLALPVELALDAVLHLPHQHHVVQCARRQGQPPHRARR